MSHLFKGLLAGIALVAILIGTSSGPLLAEAPALTSSAEQRGTAARSGGFSRMSFLPHADRSGKANPAVELIACKSEGSPCTKASQCCSKACIKGKAEGRPGAWCGADSKRR
jgi:hypothetical protein